MDYAAELGKVYLFKSMPKDQLNKLGKKAREYGLPPGASIFEEGDTGDELFVIVHGTARVLKNNAAGDPEEVATLGNGSYFGELAFVVDDHVRAATIEMTERSVLLGFKQDEVLELIAEDEALGVHLYRAIARGLARRLNSTTQDKAYFKVLARRGR